MNSYSTPGTTLSLEEENPFLNIGNEIAGQYSLPFSVPYTEKNMRLLGHPNKLATRKTAEGIPAILYHEGIQHSSGQVKMETGNGNLNHPQRGSANLYYLFGVSDFYKLVEGKTLQDLDFGPDYSFPWTKFFYNDNSFLAHVAHVMMNGSPATHEYAFFPIVNKFGLVDDPTSDMLLNNISYISPPNIFPTIIPNISSFSVPERDTENHHVNQICPFVYLRLVLKKAFRLVGWEVEGSVIDTVDFRKEVILYNNYIDWLGPAQIDGPVTWNLKNHVPRVKISSWLIALQNRFGFGYDFDYRKKKCTVYARTDIFKNRKKKDYTKKSGAGYSFKINNQKKIYALLQTNGADSVENPNFIFDGVINNFNNLPAASKPLTNHQYFIKADNAYYVCIPDENEVMTWIKSYDNTTDYKPKDSNADITTNCLVPDTIRAKIMDWDSGNDSIFTKIVPYVSLDTSLGDTDTFYICYHHGRSMSLNTASQPNIEFPFGSAGCYDLHGNLKADTALVYEYRDAPGSDRGLYENNWKYILNLLAQKEEITIPLAINFADLLNLKYTDTIVIRHVEYLIKNPHFSLPLKEYTNVDLVRI